VVAIAQDHVEGRQVARMPGHDPIASAQSVTQRGRVDGPD
jgi:hypothetical protein